jgi:hypothetical protein
MYNESQLLSITKAQEKARWTHSQCRCQSEDASPRTSQGLYNNRPCRGNWSRAAERRVTTRFAGKVLVDAEGRLIAHPDISMVLRNTDLSGLPQVQAARAAPTQPVRLSKTSMAASCSSPMRRSGRPAGRFSWKSPSMRPVRSRKGDSDRPFVNVSWGPCDTSNAGPNGGA